MDGSRGPYIVRSGSRTVDPRAADPGGRGRTHAADHHAPHCVRRMVDGGAAERVERTVWSVCERGRRSVAGIGGAIRRLCGVAEEVDGWGSTEGTGRLLESYSFRSTGGAGGARGS